MADATCEVTNGYAFGDDVGETICGKSAKVLLNGFRCCEECFVEYEANGLVEKWDWIDDGDPGPETLSAIIRIEGAANSAEGSKADGGLQHRKEAHRRVRRSHRQRPLEQVVEGWQRSRV